MRILGIETSCDETAVCLIEASGNFGPAFRYKVLGNGLLSQATLHAQYGGVFPNLAKREHAKNLVPLLHKALEEAGDLRPNTEAASGDALVPLKAILEREPELFALIVPFLVKFQKPDIDAIAVTAGPGLEPALWDGIKFAKALSAVWKIPLVAVNHMEGHLVLPIMESGPHPDTSRWREVSGLMQKFDFPVICLLISGGHTELVLSKKFGEYEIIGETRDDAAGEAFDKVARLMDLGYPGGPLISALAAEARADDSKGDFSFTRPMWHDGSFDFSFSGLKTAVRNVVTKRDMTGELKKQVAREFEECVSDVLMAKTLRAVEEQGARTVVVGGGVSANTYIRERLAEALEKADAPAELMTPPPEPASDNALMIALAGYFHAAKGEFADPAALVAKGNLRL